MCAESYTRFSVVNWSPHTNSPHYQLFGAHLGSGVGCNRVVVFVGLLSFVNSAINPDPLGDSAPAAMGTISKPTIKSRICPVTGLCIGDYPYQLAVGTKGTNEYGFLLRIFMWSEYRLSSICVDPQNPNTPPWTHFFAFFAWWKAQVGERSPSEFPKLQAASNPYRDNIVARMQKCQSSNVMIIPPGLTVQGLLIIRRKKSVQFPPSSKSSQSSQSSHSSSWCLP